jgi:hypothetical protein
MQCDTLFIIIVPFLSAETLSMRRWITSMPIIPVPDHGVPIAAITVRCASPATVPAAAGYDNHKEQNEYRTGHQFEDLSFRIHQFRSFVC